jgi:hypothetical protein
MADNVQREGTGVSGGVEKVQKSGGLDSGKG